MESVLAVVKWSMEISLHGRYPRCREDNVPFADSKKRGDKLRHMWFEQERRMKCRAGILYFKSDWAHLKTFCDLVGWQPEGPDLSCCPKCKANMSSIPANDVSRNAKWRRTTWRSHAEFMKFMIEGDRFISIMWSLPGFRVTSIISDWMHVCDLGVTQYVLGCSFDFLFMRIHGRRTRSAPFCLAMTSLIKTASRVLGQPAPVNKLTYGMFRPRSSKQPRFRCKAANTRHMVPVVLFIFKELCPQTDDLGKLHFQMLSHLNSMYEELYKWRDTGDTAARDSMSLHGRKCLILYEELRNVGATMKKYAHMWKWKPKFHLLDHLLLEVFENNPALLWNYRDESEIGNAVKVAAACHLSTVHRLVMERHMI
jgi:hypothetical protein